MLSGALLLALSITLLTAATGLQPVAAEDDYLLIEARIAAQRHDDGRVEVALEVRRDGAGWVEQITPVHRFLPDPAPIGVWWNSTPPLTVPGVPGKFGITARRLDTPRYGPDRIHTSSVDLVDEGPTRCRLGLILDRGDRCRFPDTRRSSWLGPMATRAIRAAPTRFPATSRTGLRAPRSGGSSSRCRFCTASRRAAASPPR